MNGNNVRQPACQMSFRHAVLAFAIAVALGTVPLAHLPGGEY